MASEFKTISSSTSEIAQGGPPCSGRTADGKMWCVVRASTTTNLYRSDDDGLTWTLDSSDAGTGLSSGDRCLFIDPNGKIGIGNYFKNASNIPGYVLRQTGGGFTSVYNCGTNTNGHEWGWYTRDSAGLGHAIFKRQSPAELRYYRQASADEDGSGGWTGVDNELVTSTGLTAASRPSLICDKNDVAHIIYLDSTTGRLAYRNRSGGTWSAAEDFAPSPVVHLADFTSLILGGDRLTLYVAYYAGASGTSTTPYLATRSSAGVWTSEQISGTYIASTSHVSTAVMPALDLNGGLYAYATRDQDTAYFKRVSPANWQQETLDFGATNTSAAYCTGHALHYPLIGGRPNYPSIGGWYAGRFNNGASQANQIAILRGDGLTFSSEEPYPDCPAEPTRTSYVFASEGTSEATLSIAPDFVFSGEERFVTNKMATERGYVITHAKMASSRPVFTCRFINHSLADRTALVAFIDARRSGVDAWTLTMPDGSGTKKVHILEGTFRLGKVNPGVYVTEFSVEELLS